MKKIIYFILIQLFALTNAFAVTKWQIDPEKSWADSIITLKSNTDAFEIMDKIFDKFRYYIFAFIALILIGEFIYIWYLFITSEWDEAQYKKAWKTFIYTIIWIIIIILAWAAVKLVTTIWI